MRNWLNKYFGFTKREYNGLLVFMAMLLLLSVLPRFYAKFLIDPGSITKADRAAMSQLRLVDRQSPQRYQHVQYEIEENDIKPTVVLFKFDPNQLNLQQWQQLGLSAKQAKSILNYVAKGGKFYRPTDLKKMYTISSAKYLELEPFIDIPPQEFAGPLNGEFKRSVKKEKQIIEINTADTLLLDELKGIGSAFAKRIVKYREQLGGFYKKEQLLEVFGLDSLKYQEIVAQISVDASLVRKININTADFEVLKKHPYLKYKQINAIIQYRKQHGNYNNVDDLKKVLILTPQNIQNLAPYLVF